MVGRAGQFSGHRAAQRSLLASVGELKNIQYFSSHLKVLLAGLTSQLAETDEQEKIKF